MDEIDSTQAKRILEVALLCAQEPMQTARLRELFAGNLSTATIQELILQIQTDWQGKGIQLCLVATGWRFQSQPEFQYYLDRLNPEKPPKYSRATLETLAIIAYRQPVTRGDIEDIRGVTVSTQIIKQLEDRGWIESIGHRDAPGRPALFATTKHFLDDFGIFSLADLPPINQIIAIEEQATVTSSSASEKSQHSLLDLPVLTAPTNVSQLDIMDTEDESETPITKQEQVIYNVELEPLPDSLSSTAAEPGPTSN